MEGKKDLEKKINKNSGAICYEYRNVCLFDFSDIIWEVELIALAK